MNALVLLVIAAVVLVIGYICYGGWLSKQWGIDDSIETPAHSMEDGVDYVPAKPYVVIGHHFSSIAGAGPINGPIQAAIFGWVPVLLWVLIARFRCTVRFVAPQGPNTGCSRCSEHR